MFYSKKYLCTNIYTSKFHKFRSINAFLQVIVFLLETTKDKILHGEHLFTERGGGNTPLDHEGGGGGSTGPPLNIIVVVKIS